MYAEHWHAHNWLIKKLVNDKIKARLPHLNGAVVDLGCGVRPFEQDILCYASTYTGVDWSNTLHGLKADVVADLNKQLPLDTDSVDHVVSFEVLEHLAEPGVMLNEACRILHSGGSLMLSVPFQWWVHEAPWDYQRFTCHGLAYQLAKAGFTDISIEPTSGFWSMWLLKLNYQMTRLIRGPRFTRGIIRAMCIPIWWINQVIAPIMDRYWPEDRETAGYFAIAHKP
jgi:SAM-dependent methyltransferase